MKFYKKGIRLWITVTSLLSFLVGWAMLAHAPKPAQASSSPEGSVAPLPTLAPLPPLSDDGNSFQNPSVLMTQPRGFFRQSPFFTTGGS
jgi:hypothetical protein